MRAEIILYFRRIQLASAGGASLRRNHGAERAVPPIAGPCGKKRIAQGGVSRYAFCRSSQARRTAAIISSTMAGLSAALATPEEEPVASAPAKMVS